ncbi:MAG: hypothetical protein KC493_06015 [Bacteriovoracaceae bacterium]|nr:hypothetical protein [Bacteriovoracaceae bacterium]
MEKINILYQDDFVIAVEKPSGLLVHPYWKETNEKENLMKTVRDQVGKKLYPLHRLDRPVSGIVLFGLSGQVVKDLQLHWHFANTKKEYITLCRNIITEPGEWNFTLKNDKGVEQKARTLYWPLAQFEDTTLCRVRIKTGRKHQIRRHFARRMFNIIGDTAKGNGPMNRKFREEFDLQRIFLHAWKFEIEHPETEELLKLECELPPELASVVEKLGLPIEKLKEILHKDC